MKHVQRSLETFYFSLCFDFVSTWMRGDEGSNGPADLPKQSNSDDVGNSIRRFRSRDHVNIRFNP